MAITNSDSTYTNNYSAFENWIQNPAINEKKSLKGRLNSLNLEKEIVNFLIFTGNIGKTRNELVSQLKYPRTTIYDSLNRMGRHGLIEVEHKLSNKGKGRPHTIFYLRGYFQGNSRR